MKNWFKLPQRRSSSLASHPFEVTCRCGNTVAGERTERGQAVVCPQCETRCFVLPRDPYRTIVSSPVTSTDGRSKPSATVAETDEINDCSAAQIVGYPCQFGLGRIQGGIARFARRQFSPFRIMLVCVLVIVGVTIWQVWRSRVVNAAEANLRNALERIDQLEPEDDPIDFLFHYQQAVESLMVLERSDAEALRIQQQTREIEAMANLLDQPLETIVSESRQQHGDRKGWPDSINRKWNDVPHWVVIDVACRVEGNGEGTFGLVTEIPAVFHSELIILRMNGIPPDHSIAELVQEASTNEIRIVFGARLRQIAQSEPVNEAGSRLVVEVDSLFLWATDDFLRRLGFEVNPERDVSVPTTAEILRNQREVLGLEP